MSESKISRRDFLRKSVYLAGGTTLIGIFGSTAIAKAGTPPKKFQQVYKVPQSTKPLKQQILKWYNLGSTKGDPAIVTTTKRFEKVTGIKSIPVEIPPGEDLTRYTSALRAKSSKVDIYNAFDITSLALMQEHYFEEIGDFMRDPEKWSPAVHSLAKWPQPAFEGFGGGPTDFPYREGIYGAPWFAECWVPFYNMKKLEEAGLNPETTAKTFGEFKEVATKLAEVTKNPVLFPYSNTTEGGQILDGLKLRSAGSIFDSAAVKPSFRNEGFGKALNFFVSLIKEGLAPKAVIETTEDRVAIEFFKGNAGIMFNSLENIFVPGAELPIEEPVEEVARPAPYPTPADIEFEDFQTAPSAALTPFLGHLSIFSKHKTAGALLLDYFARQESQAIELLEEGNMPCRADVFDLPLVKRFTPHAEAIKTIAKGAGREYFPKRARIADIQYEETVKAILGKQSPEEAMEEMQNRAEPLFK